MGSSDMNLSAERVQHLFREVNERIRLIAAGEHPSFLCECANPGCTGTINVGVEDYERVREFPGLFIVRAGHELIERERIVEDREGFVVVETVGAPASVVNVVNPRRLTLPTLS